MSVWDGFKFKLGVGLFDFFEFAVFLLLIFTIVRVIIWLDSRRKPMANIFKNPIMKYFGYEHLPPALQEVSKPICELAIIMDAGLPDGPEKSAGLRKLLEAKDCFVRAHLP